VSRKDTASLRKVIYHIYSSVAFSSVDTLVMGGATDFKVGVQNRIRERSECNFFLLYPHFSKCGGTSKQISVGAY